MPPLYLRDSMSRTKREFIPIDADNVRLYVCGPTVYARAHIGNLRSVLVFDILFRLLSHAYGEGHVTYVRNITDIDDKIIARMAETGQSLTTVTTTAAREFYDDTRALGMLGPTETPWATAHVWEMHAMIQALIGRGHAYEAAGHVLFRVRSFPDYGKLSGRSVDQMRAGARVEVAPYKEDPLDFVLWKPAPEPELGFTSPWGRGRPGWHIECSAMANCYLGPHFDIHGGGQDLQFPHHENEIAQSRAAHGHDRALANYWLHNAMVTVEGQKMSKSEGNVLTLGDLQDHGVEPMVARLALLTTHYAKPLDWTSTRVSAARSILEKWRRKTAGVEAAETLDETFLKTLSNDLNTAGALAVMQTLEPPALLAAGRFLGVL